MIIHFEYVKTHYAILTWKMHSGFIFGNMRFKICTPPCRLLFCAEEVYVVFERQLILYFKRRLSAIIAINSLLVGFPLVFCIVYPKYEFRVSISPLSHATSIAWRIARSTLEVVVEYFLATEG